MEKLLEKRSLDSHKGNYGRLGIMAGSTGMTGSAYLASQAGLRTGSGLVYAMVPRSLESIMSIKLTEAIIEPIQDFRKGYFIYESIGEILDLAARKDALVVGPGIGLGPSRINILRDLVKNFSRPLLIDADGLNCLAQDLDILKNRKGPLVLTPHPGEFSRLTGLDLGTIEANREEVARNFAQDQGLVLVLKGQESLVVSPGGAIYINKTGNPGMATAGSGDVLSGIIGSLLGQGLEAYSAARLGVYLHGLAGDLAREDKGEHGMIASDILAQLPYAIKSFMEK